MTEPVMDEEDIRRRAFERGLIEGAKAEEALLQNCLFFIEELERLTAELRRRLMLLMPNGADEK